MTVIVQSRRTSRRCSICIHRKTILRMTNGLLTNWTLQTVSMLTVSKITMTCFTQSIPHFSMHTINWRMEIATESGFRRWQWSVFRHRQSDCHKFDEFVDDHHERQKRDCHAKHPHLLRCVQFWKTAARNLEIIPMVTHTKCVGRLGNAVRVSSMLWTVSITRLAWNT